MPEHHTNTKPRTEVQYWYYLLMTIVKFSDCGSFCFLTDFHERMVILKSNLLKINAAKVQIPAVWGGKTSYNQSFFHVIWRGESTTVKLYQVLDRGYSTRLVEMEHTISVAITVIPAHLASGAVYLLVGKSADDLTRVLFLPEKGSPEIKYLRVTLNQILDELARRRLLTVTEKDAGDIQADEDESRISYAESSDTRSEVAAMSADDDRPEVLDSEKSSDKSSEVASMSADED